jgi:murein DD-endopeptidase MepM/ murein hydrolase activator NlpD
MLTVPVTGKTISRGFGLQIILEATNQKYWHEGVNYKVKANDPVYACLPGKVIYVGETRLSGTTVVVDHGAGLKSLYAHLGTTSVSVGDEVEKGDMIAIVGSSGFCSGTSFHFGLYVFDVPVRYYDYETYGINLESSVAEALGLKQSGSIG